MPSKITVDAGGWPTNSHVAEMESRSGGDSGGSLSAAFKKLQAGEISDNEYSLIRAKHEGCAEAMDESDD